MAERAQVLADRDFLYPELSDPDFNLKLALKKEFADAQYDGKIHDIEKQANLLCSAKFELMPHQIFVKNFLSSQTPYNSLLLFHGLGTGKTCSAIGVAEEMRQYMKSIGVRDKILVVASPNVQGNFRLQLFDESRLMKLTNVANQNEYTWNIESCVGNSLLREINPNSIRNLTREKLVSNINALINEQYSFMGYIQLANLITTVIGGSRTNDKTNDKANDKAKDKAKDKDREIHNIRQFFDGKLIIVDEVHNIRISEDNARKDLQQVAALLMRVAKHAVGLRLLLLSATPMFNSYKEIVWITNLLNANDKRATIQVADVFDAEGQFKVAKSAEQESGDAVLRRKLTGYVSYVRGENPYTFPYRIYPRVFAPDKAMVAEEYPTLQMNGTAIDAPLAKLQLYMNRCDKSTFQIRAYFAFMEYMRKRTYGYYTTKGQYREMPSFENMEAFGYTLLQKPVEMLDFVFPSEGLEQIMQVEDDDARAEKLNDNVFESSVGHAGLQATMTYQTMLQGNPLKHEFEYRPAILKKYGRIFSEEKVGQYSAKIAEICREIRRSEGVVLIYSQYIDGGIVPMALALEEMGLAKYSHSPSARPLFKRRPVDPVDAIHMLPRAQLPPGSEFSPAQYIVITGDKGISASNTEDVRRATAKDNKDGAKVKVILISKAGSEGIDFKFVRQVHVLDPGYNMNRIEQIIGRGVRNLSHCALPFNQRNVQIYLHATLFRDSPEEAADLYLYRLSEKKAVQIGRVSRVIKESASDCLLHIGQSNFTADKLAAVAQNQSVVLRLSSKDPATGKCIETPFRIGDASGSEICDYMSCEYQCRPHAAAVSADAADKRSYTTFNAQQNQHYISSRIREMFRENHAFTLDEIVREINLVRTYPIEQIFYVLSSFVGNKTEYLFDRYGRFGYLIRRGKYYAFQPIEISDERASVFDRSRPVEYRRDAVAVEFPKTAHAFDSPAPAPRSGEDAAAAPAAAESGGSYAELVRQIESQVQTTQSANRVNAEEKDWYKNASKILPALQAEFGLSDENVRKFTVHHAIESLDYAPKKTLMEQTYGRSVFDVSPVVEAAIANYFKAQFMFAKSRVGVFLANKEQNVFLVLDEAKGAWETGDELDLGDFAGAPMRTYEVDKRALHRLMGYILNFKGQDMAFYYKDITLQRNKKGRRCDRSGGKVPVYSALNQLLGREQYSAANTAHVYSGGLCVVMEMLMRQFHEEQKDGRIYILTPEQAIRSRITDFSSV